MNVRHLDLGSMRELPGDDGTAKRAVSHALLVEAGDGLVLVETGLGLGDVHDPVPSLGTMFVERTAPLLRQADTAVSHLARLGYDPLDVRDIVLTHLDVDHSGGLPDFPHARCICTRPRFAMPWGRARIPSTACVTGRHIGLTARGG